MIRFLLSTARPHGLMKSSSAQLEAPNDITWLPSMSKILMRCPSRTSTLPSRSTAESMG
jgi:hypothetical protein